MQGKRTGLTQNRTTGFRAAMPFALVAAMGATGAMAGPTKVDGSNFIVAETDR
jgi:hypothetical protein